MISPWLPGNWRIPAYLIACSRAAFEIRTRHTNADPMQNGREPGRFARNPSPLWGLTSWLSAPTFLPRRPAGGQYQYSPIPVTPRLARRPGVALYMCTPLQGGPATTKKRTDHV